MTSPSYTFLYFKKSSFIHFGYRYRSITHFFWFRFFSRDWDACSIWEADDRLDPHPPLLWHLFLFWLKSSFRLFLWESEKGEVGRYGTWGSNDGQCTYTSLYGLFHKIEVSWEFSFSGVLLMYLIGTGKCSVRYATFLTQLSPQRTYLPYVR